MSLTVELLRTSWRLIVDDPKKTLTTIAPAIVLFVLSGAIAFLIPLLLQQPHFGQPHMIVNLVSWCVYGVGIVLMAVRWHRYVLLPPSGKTPMAAYTGYFGYLAAMFVIIFVGGAIFAGALTLINAALYGTFGFSAGAVTMLLLVLLYALAAWVGVRISLVLPAAALQMPISFAHSWALTAPVKWAILLAYLCVFVPLTIVYTMVDEVLGGSVASLIAILHSLANLSLLSVMYAKLVQNEAAA